MMFFHINVESEYNFITNSVNNYPLCKTYFAVTNSNMFMISNSTFSNHENINVN